MDSNKRTVLNIGLDTNKGGSNNLTDVICIIKEYINGMEYRTQRSSTENTLILMTYDTITDDDVVELCDRLHQDAIALKRGDVGVMIHGHNKTKDWGEFNQEYFIEYK